MRKLIKSIFIAVFVIMLLDSCQIEDPIQPMVEVSYSADIKPILNASCSNGYCHYGSTDELSIFSEYDVIKLVVESGELYSQVVELKTMPKFSDGEVDPNFSNENRQLIADWIEAGAFNN